MTKVEELMTEIRRLKESRLPWNLSPADQSVLVDEIDRLQADNRNLRTIVNGLAERVAAQSHLLSRKSEIRRQTAVAE